MSGLGSPSSKSEVAESKTFKINLFPESSFMKGDDSHKDQNDDDNSGFITIDIDGTSDLRTFNSYLNDLDLKDDGDKAADSKYDDDDDLLALMDSAKWVYFRM